MVKLLPWSTIRAKVALVNSVRDVSSPGDNVVHVENYAVPASPALAEELRSIALDAGREAAALLRANFRSGIAAEHKTNPHDLVTELDRLSQQLITERLLRGYPDSWVLGEEVLAGQPEPKTGGGVQWIVDPLDGTSNFVHGVAFFCVSIAAAVEDQLVAAVVIDPIGEDEFSANLEAAFLNGERLHPAARPEQARANLMTDYPSAEALDSDEPVALQVFGQWVRDFATVRRKVSAALALAHVAAGWCDATVGFDTKAWDVAAGAHLVEMSGGSYRGLFHGAGPGPAHLAPGFIAQGPGADYPSLRTAADRIAALRSTRHRD